MGNCSSCIGDRGRDVYDEVSLFLLIWRLAADGKLATRAAADQPTPSQDDEAQHLFGDPNNQYGTFDQQHMTSQEDPQEVQREIEALQRVVARTSECVLLPTPSPPLFQDHGSGTT